MRKLLVLILSAFICFASIAEETTAVETTESVEQITDGSLFFTAEILAAAIAEIIPEKNQSAAAAQYEKVMNPENGRIKVEGLFSVCRTGGFNTYSEVGFNDCKKFINKLLTDSQQESDDRLLGGYCPGLDANGKNPNSLSTITNKNMVGDFCSSANIAVGEIAYNQTISKKSKTDYSCTCVASSCNPGFEFKGGSCNAIVADGQGFCLRSEYPETSENNTTQKCVDFCGVVATKKGCKYSAVVMRHSTKQCLCNPTNNEIDLAKDSMQKAEESRLAKLPYYEVCGQHRGGTGAKEYCISEIFNWTNVGQLQAVGLAKEYARVRLGQTIQCDSKYRASENDDWVKCVSTDGKSFYEFKFDDVKESLDNTINQGVVLGIYAIHNMTLTSATCTPGVIASAKVFGYTATMQNNICRLNYTKMTADDAESNLAKINGIDNRVFFHGIQVQGSQSIIAKLKTYIQGQGIKVNTFTCDAGLGKIDNGWMGGKDDILRCYMNGAPIDFVFDDLSEAWKYVQEAGDSGIQCIVSGGKYQGSNCHGLTQKQCTQSNIALKKEFPGISGTKWQNGMCVLVDASQAATYDILVQVGVGLVAAVDCVVLTHTGCAILAVELAGLATEVTANVSIGNRAEDFLKESVRCKSRDCSIKTLRDLSGKVLSVKSSLKPQDLHAVDSELARLVGLLDSLEDLGGADLSGAEWEDIVTKLGGDSTDSGGTALVWASRVGLVAQFASIGASALRLTGAAVAKLGAKSSRMGATGTRAITNADRKFYDVWKVYAPKDQSFADFKEMWGNDLTKMEGGVKDFVKNTEFSKTIEKRGELFDLMDKYDIDTMPSDPTEFAEFRNKYPDLAKAMDESGVGAAGNYSTFDPNVSKVTKEFDAGVNKIENEQLLLRRRIIEANVNGDLSYDKAVEQIDLLNDYKNAEIVSLKKETINNNANLLSKEAIERVAAERREQFMKTIGNDPELKKMALNFKQLSDDEKIKFGQKLLDESGTINCIGDKCEFKLPSTTDPDVKPSLGGWYNFEGISVVKENNKDLDTFMNVLSHEDGHRIDNLNPNQGALGAQKNYISGKIYQNPGTVSYDTYRNTLQEQSSFAIGDNVGAGFKNELVGKYGTPMQKIENTANNLSAEFLNANPKVVVPVSIGAAAVGVGGAAAVGVGGAAAVRNIIQNNDSKNEKDKSDKIEFQNLNQTESIKDTTGVNNVNYK